MIAIALVVEGVLLGCIGVVITASLYWLAGRLYRTARRFQTAVALSVVVLAVAFGVLSASSLSQNPSAALYFVLILVGTFLLFSLWLFLLRRSASSISRRV